MCSSDLLGGRTRHTQYNLILQARVLMLEGGSNTLGINDTFGEARPSLGRRRGPRFSAPKDDVITTPGQSLPGENTPCRPLSLRRTCEDYARICPCYALNMNATGTNKKSFTASYKFDDNWSFSHQHNDSKYSYDQYDKTWSKLTEDANYHE